MCVSFAFIDFLYLIVDSLKNIDMVQKLYFVFPVEICRTIGTFE